MGRDDVPGRAPASFRSTGVDQGLRARGDRGLGPPAPPRSRGGFPALRDPRGRSDSVPQPVLRFHKIRGDCTSSSAFKGPHTLAAAIKCYQRHACRRGTAELPQRLLTPPGRLLAAPGSPPAAHRLRSRSWRGGRRLKEGTVPALALSEYPVQILPPTGPRASTCANNALSRL